MKLFGILLFTLIAGCASKKTETDDGGYDREGVRQVIRNNLPAIKDCYEPQQKINPTLEGKVVVTLVIEAEGKVRSAVIKKTSLNNKIVEDCVLERLKTQTFPVPLPDTVAEIAYPFVFTPNKPDPKKEY